MKNDKKVIVIINGIMAKEMSVIEAMDIVWDVELNTEEHPVHIYDHNGNEIEW